VYVAGMLLAALGRLVVQTQPHYSPAAREGLERIEGLLDLAELRVRTTPAMGSIYRRRITVTNALLIVFAVLFGLDLIGVAYAVWVLFS
jgi:hypothetical protein